MVEGYDAADPRRASTFAIRDEWMARGESQQGRVAEGYGALVEYLVSECRRLGAAINGRSSPSDALVFLFRAFWMSSCATHLSCFTMAVLQTVGVPSSKYRAS
jgi:hypothetical protein